MGDSTTEEDILTTVLFSKLESDWEPRCGDSTPEEYMLTTVLFSKLESDWEPLCGGLNAGGGDLQLRRARGRRHAQGPGHHSQKG